MKIKRIRPPKSAHDLHQKARDAFWSVQILSHYGRARDSMPLFHSALGLEIEAAKAAGLDSLAAKLEDLSQRVPKRSVVKKLGEGNLKSHLLEFLDCQRILDEYFQGFVLARRAHPLSKIKWARLWVLLPFLAILFYYLHGRIVNWNHGLRGSYYAGQNFNTFKSSRIDGEIYFRFLDEEIPPGLSPHHFSVRWEGKINIPNEGEYLFLAKSDDGVRLWINGKMILENWTVHPEAINEARVHLSPGWTPIRIDYFQEFGASSIKLFWMPPGKKLARVPTRFLNPSEDGKN